MCEAIIGHPHLVVHFHKCLVTSTQPERTQPTGSFFHAPGCAHCNVGNEAQRQIRYRRRWAPRTCLGTSWVQSRGHPAGSPSPPGPSPEDTRRTVWRSLHTPTPPPHRRLNLSNYFPERKTEISNGTKKNLGPAQSRSLTCRISDSVYPLSFLPFYSQSELSTVALKTWAASTASVSTYLRKA